MEPNPVFDAGMAASQNTVSSGRHPADSNGTNAAGQDRPEPVKNIFPGSPTGWSRRRNLFKRRLVNFLTTAEGRHRCSIPAVPWPARRPHRWALRASPAGPPHHPRRMRPIAVLQRAGKSGGPNVETDRIGQTYHTHLCSRTAARHAAARPRSRDGDPENRVSSEDGWASISRRAARSGCRGSGHGRRVFQPPATGAIRRDFEGDAAAVNSMSCARHIPNASSR